MEEKQSRPGSATYLVLGLNVVLMNLYGTAGFLNAVGDDGA